MKASMKKKMVLAMMGLMVASTVLSFSKTALADNPVTPTKVGNQKK